MENLIDRRCTGCKQFCDDTMYYACSRNDYKFYTSEPKNDKEILWGEKCKTCKNKFCNIDKAEKCIENDYKFYKDNSVIVEKIEVVQSKPKYNSLIIFSSNERPSSIEEELNEYFTKNPTDTIFSIKEIITFRGNSLLIIFEKH